MVDEDFNLWGIEINCYPDLSVVTPTMQVMVPAMMEDLVKGIQGLVTARRSELTWSQWWSTARECQSQRSAPVCGRAPIAARFCSLRASLWEC
jgi:hypothetical protein